MKFCNLSDLIQKVCVPNNISNVQSGFQGGKFRVITLSYYVLPYSIEHTFLFKTLDVMGIGDYVIKLIKIAFTGCMSYANINGYLSKPIYLIRGLHQGSPLSPILFLMIAQVFSKKLKIIHDITGFAIQGIYILLSLFADDTDIFLQATSQAVEAVIREFNDFGYHSGCNPNVDKTCCIPLSNAKNNDNLFQDIRIKYGDDFIKHSFSSLGVASETIFPLMILLRSIITPRSTRLSLGLESGAKKTSPCSAK